MEITYDYYRIFYYVAKYKSFSKAATILMSSQPNISRFMSNLESQLGCKLFIRSNRGVTLTLEGQKLYHHVSIAFQHLQAAEMELAQDRSLEHGILTLSASEIALHLLLLPVLSKFHQTYPGIRLRISNHSTPQAIQAVKNGEVDFAVVTTPTGAEGELKKVDLMSFNEILVGGKTFTALASRTLSLQELDAYPLIMLGNESMSRLFYRQFFLEHSADLKPDIEAATTDQMMTLVKSELGLAFVPEPMARSSLRRRSIVQLTLREEIPQRSVSLIYDRHRPLNTAAREFQKQLLNAARQEKAE